MSLRRWLPVAALLGVLLLECAAGLLALDSDSDIEGWLSSDDPEQRVRALHLFANRGEPERAFFGGSFKQELFLQNEDLRLRLFPFTNEVCKFEEPIPSLQNFWVDGPKFRDPNSPVWWMSYVIYKRKVGGAQVGSSLRLRLVELEWWFEAQRAERMPGAAIHKHLRGLAMEVRERRFGDEESE